MAQPQPSLIQKMETSVTSHLITLFGRMMDSKMIKMDIVRLSQVNTLISNMFSKV